MIIRSTFRWLLTPPEESRPWWKVITWWEVRRIPCNLIVGCVGFVCLLLFFLFIHLAHELTPGEDAVEPMALFIAPILFNVAYTGGWIAELMLRIVWREQTSRIAPALFKLGLTFSLFVVMLPAVVWFGIWLKRSI